MEVQFINITTYKGISSDADHYYGRVGDARDLQEYYLFNIACKPDEGVLYVGDGKDLRHFPSREEATELFFKDNADKQGKPLSEFDKKRIDAMVRGGVPRFPSVISLVRAARKEFPDATLCFSYQGSRTEFAKLLARDNELAEQVTEEFFKTKTQS